MRSKRLHTHAVSIVYRRLAAARSTYNHSLESDRNLKIRFTGRTIQVGERCAPFHCRFRLKRQYNLEQNQTGPVSSVNMIRLLGWAWALARFWVSKDKAVIFFSVCTSHAYLGQRKIRIPAIVAKHFQLGGNPPGCTYC